MFIIIFIEYTSAYAIDITKRGDQYIYTIQVNSRARGGRGGIDLPHTIRINNNNSDKRGSAMTLV